MAGKRNRTPDSSEWGEPLKLPGTSQRAKVGRVERGVNSAIAHARRDGSLSQLDDGAIATARELARTVDWCAANTEPHTLTLASARLSELLTKLRLEPSARQVKGGGDAFDQFLEDLGTPTFGDAAQP